LFLLTCYVELVKSWVTSKISCAVVIEDPWVLRTLQRQESSHPRIHRVSSFGPLLSDFMIWRLRFPLSRLLFLMRSLRSYLNTRTIPKLRNVPPYWIFSWVENRCFSTKKTFTDAYTGRLDAILGSLHCSTIRWTPLTLTKDHLRQLHEQDQPFIVTPRYASL